MPINRNAIALQWAELLDADDFEQLPAMIHPQCQYKTGKETLVGPVAIVNSYRDASEWAYATFDTIIWDSEVASPDADGRVRITFIDITKHAGEDHVYQCQQVITIDDDGLVSRIKHIAIPDEERALEAFLARVGI